MKKKLISIVLAAALAGSLAGCSSQLSNKYVTVTQYKGLEVPEAEAATEEITDDQVEQTIQSNLSQSAERETVTDRAAEMGDIVNIDYTGSIDGQNFDGGSATGTELELGSNSFIGATDNYKGFEEQIVGHNTGDEFDITVQFPDPYEMNPDLAGAVANFHIVLNSIEKENVPELTDKWVKANSDKSKTVKEYKKEIKDQLEQNQEDSVRSELSNSVQTALLEKIEVKEYPQDEVDELKKQMTDVYTQMAQMYGMELGEFLQSYMQTTEDEFNSQIEESAKNTVAFDEAAKLIAKKQNLEPTKKEYEEKMEEYAKNAGVSDVDTYKKQVGEDTLKKAILRDAVTDYLVDKCIQVEQTDSSSEE